MHKRKLYIITLEPIEQRYTKQWYETWEKKFSKWFNVQYIDGDFVLTADGNVINTKKIEKGKFLDINYTNKWKATQVNMMSKLFINNEVKDDDVFLFMDGWHFGVIALKYMLDLNNIKAKMFAYWHAGTWDEHDFLTQKGLREWAKGFEESCFKVLNGSFVATNYHNELIKDYFFPKMENYDNDEYIDYENAFDNNVHVVGMPIDWMKEVKGKWRCYKGGYNIVVFPNRLDKEKQPEVFDKLSKQMPKYSFIKTMVHNRSKTRTEYYSLLSVAKVVFSSSLQETFGIAMVEALMFNCIPIVPDKLSYSELYHPMFKYNDLKDAKNKIKFFVDCYKNKDVQLRLKENQQRIIKQSNESWEKMAKIMLRTK